MSLVGSLVDVDTALAEWMFVLLLSLGRTMVVVIQDTYRLVPLIFGTTFVGMSKSLCQKRPMVWYRLVRAGIHDDMLLQSTEGSMYGSVLFACLSALVVSLPKSSTEYRAISREMWYHYSSSYYARHACIEVAACGLALGYIYNDASLVDTRCSSLCILRASLLVLSGTGRETVRMTVPRHMLDILARNPPLSMQVWVLEEMRVHCMKMYTNANKDNENQQQQQITRRTEDGDMFAFAMNVVESSTRGMTVMHPSSPALIIDILGFLNPFRSSGSSLFKKHVLCLIDILEKNPEYATPIIQGGDSMPVSRDTPCTAAQASRIQLVFSILLPCCHRLEPSLITEYLGPYSLSLLRHAWGHPSLAFVVNDMCCSIMTHSMDMVNTFASTYITTYLEVFRHHRYDPSLLGFFATGFVTIIQCCPDSSTIQYLDILLNACPGFLDNHVVLFGIVQTAAYSLDIVPLCTLPTACARFKVLFGVLRQRGTSSEAYHGCRGHVLQVIQSSHDCTRLSYLAEQFSDMVHA